MRFNRIPTQFMWELQPAAFGNLKMPASHGRPFLTIRRLLRLELFPFFRQIRTLCGSGRGKVTSGTAHLWAMESTRRWTAAKRGVISVWRERNVSAELF